MRSLHDIPLCFNDADYKTKATADPLYPLEHAIDVAMRVGEAETTREGIDKFFSIRSQELDADLKREKQLVTQREIGSINECIANASLLLNKPNLPFPRADRYHIDIGCGLGFGLIASSKSYFGQNVIGIDLSPHYLVLAKKHLAENGIDEPKLFCADICDGWPIPLDKYDVSFISMEGVLEHIKDVPAFFRNVQKIKSYPFVLYLTVPYRWTLQHESHFNMRLISWLPKSRQDEYIARRLGVDTIDHVEFYSVWSLRRLLRRFFAKSAITIAKNSNNPAKSHYLRAAVYVGGPGDLVQD